MVATTSGSRAAAASRRHSRRAARVLGRNGKRTRDVASSSVACPSGVPSHATNGGRAILPAYLTRPRRNRTHVLILDRQSELHVDRQIRDRAPAKVPPAHAVASRIVTASECRAA